MSGNYVLSLLSNVAVWQLIGRLFLYLQCSVLVKRFENFKLFFLFLISFFDQSITHSIDIYIGIGNSLLYPMWHVTHGWTCYSLTYLSLSDIFFLFFVTKGFVFAIKTLQTYLELYFLYVYTYFLSQMLIFLNRSNCRIYPFANSKTMSHTELILSLWVPNGQYQHFTELKKKVGIHVHDI